MASSLLPRVARSRSTVLHHLPQGSLYSTQSIPFHISKRYASSAVASAQEQQHHYDETTSEQAQPTAKPSTPLTAEQRKYLDSALRVNQAGELAAVLIYSAQNPIITRSHPHLRPLMQHMYDQEAGHYKLFNQMLAKHRIRPTVMNPVWTVAATALGWGTAMLGREAAMACTEAVETEIGEHYNEQVRTLLEWERAVESRGETVGEELKELLGTLRRIRDEELEHLDHAVDNDAKEAKPYELLTNVIRGGCRGAIWLTERL